MHIVFRYIALIILIYSNDTAMGAVDYERIDDSLYKLSLEELLNIKVDSSSTLTKIPHYKRPASVTVISEQDIRFTPARNINDLLEVYVPGLFYSIHDEGVHPGIRGIIADRNYNLLLLVNGRNINQKSHNGAFTEIDQWQLSDIKQIEVIRGPGSVIHGPGALSGVINIITHSAETVSGTRVDLEYSNKYDAKELALTHSESTESGGYYLFFSATKNKGLQQRSFFDSGYVSDEVPDHYGDFDDKPQLKMHADLQLNEDWRLWTRYTESNQVKLGQVKADINGRLVNKDHHFKRHWMFTVEHSTKITNGSTIKSTLSVDSLDAEDINKIDDGKSFRANFSEDEIYIRSQLNWLYSDKLALAIGAKYSRDKLGPGWGEDKEDMILGDGRNIISGPESVYYNQRVAPEDAIFAGNGWSTNSYALFAESNFDSDDTNIFILSARLDKNDLTETAFSGRAAWVKNLSDRHLFKAIIQRSVRYSTLEQQWAQDKVRGKIDKPAVLNNIEFIYSFIDSKHHHTNTSLFYIDAEVFGFSSRDHESRNIGDLKLAGIEFEYSFNWERWNLGFNHSYINLIDWELSSDQPKSGISYSDYNQTTDDLFLLTGNGDSLNNWSHHISKFYLRYSPINHLTIHLDSHVYWGFDGHLDGVEETIIATEGDASQQDAINRAQLIKDADGYELDARLNLSLSYQMTKTTFIQVFVHNLLGKNNNKRYWYDSGNSSSTFTRAKWVEEERYIGVRFRHQFQ
mgnify:CR=1 FL=1